MPKPIARKVPFKKDALVEAFRTVQNNRARSLGRQREHGMSDEYLRGLIVGLEIAGSIVNGLSASEALVFVTAFQDSVIKQVKGWVENA